MNWTETQTIKALIIYKMVKKTKTEIIKREIDKDDIFLKDKHKTLDCKFSNFLSLDKGLPNASSQDKNIWETYKDFTIKKLEKVLKEKQAKKS